MEQNKTSSLEKCDDVSGSRNNSEILGLTHGTRKDVKSQLDVEDARKDKSKGSMSKK